MPSAATHAPIAAADWLRRRWLHLLGDLARPLVRRRELRVTLMFSAMICTALAATLVAPLWLLILGPLLWGVPHLVSDLRYLVIRTGYHRRPLLWLVAGAPLLWVGLGGGLVWGFVGAALAAACARARLAPRLLAVGLLALGGAGFVVMGRLGDVAFAHAHNFIAVALWWLWRPRSGRLHWLPLALLVAASLFLLSDAALWLAQHSGGLAWFAGRMGPDYQVWRLSPGVAPDLALRLVLLFCFAQSIHYAVWLQLLPDEDRQRATPPTFRASYEDLRADFGGPGLAIAGLLALGIAVWAAFDLMHASHGYFRMARFHGHLEVMAGALLLLERSRR
ncbi:hypothetical protein [Nannocystis sp.]|uniref:hypothetical protein n=1 Tax=Nannocystis sp. TaxID=1962667 RepID=UPI0025D32412|nr:hypothetical protein [Nannocystis sp.]MBK7827610.1 hypothetical protein [Nannocystis sp.]